MLKLRDVFAQMEHNRDLVLGVVFREKTDASLKLLEFVLDESHKKQTKDKEFITLDSCMRAFSREEMLSGSDQWYCNRCKEQRDIHKKLELYRLPKIMIIQLKRFQSKRSASKASGFLSMAYAQIAQQEKVGDLVDFPVEGLDMRQYVQDQSIRDSPNPVLYDLYAVSNHYGGLHGGHYTAYALNSES